MDRDPDEIQLHFSSKNTLFVPRWGNLRKLQARVHRSVMHDMDFFFFCLYRSLPASHAQCQLNKR